MPYVVVAFSISLNSFKIEFYMNFSFMCFQKAFVFPEGINMRFHALYLIFIVTPCSGYLQFYSS